jgi:hypothetical protein
LSATPRASDGPAVHWCVPCIRERHSFDTAVTGMRTNE